MTEPNRKPWMHVAHGERAMTTKAYIVIADVLRQTKPMRVEYLPDDGIPYAAALAKWREIVIKSAEMFAAQNSNFQRMRFFRACSLDPADVPTA